HRCRHVRHPAGAFRADLTPGRPAAAGGQEHRQALRHRLRRRLRSQRLRRRQYIALVLPTRVFRAEFARRGLAPYNLSRLAADSATVPSPLIAWNSCGAFMGAVLGVSAFRYLPFAIFCYASPVLSVLYGITGFKIEKTVPADGAETRESLDVSSDGSSRLGA